MHIRQVNWVPKIDEKTEMKVKISIVARQAIFDEITLNNISWSGRLEEPDFLKEKTNFVKAGRVLKAGWVDPQRLRL